MQTSRDITTAGGKRAYVYQAAPDRQECICTGCGWSDTKVGIAPALAATSAHARQCKA
jgi:hypothetical protein